MTVLLDLVRAVERFVATRSEEGLYEAAAAARVVLDEEALVSRTEVPAWASPEVLAEVERTLPAWALGWPVRASGGWRGIRRIAFRPRLIYEVVTTTTTEDNMESLNERILAEAQARPQISISLMDTLLGNAREDIAAAFRYLETSGELVRRGNIYWLRNSHPDPDTLLMMLANIPRPQKELERATRWRPELVRACVERLMADGFVVCKDGTNKLSCTDAGLHKCGWPTTGGFVAPLRSNGGPPPPPPISKSLHDAERRNRLADMFAPVVLAWVLNNRPDVLLEGCAASIATRSYELADAMIGAGA